MNEARLLELARGGDSRAMEEMLSAYKGMVKALARQYFIIGAAEEDASQEGMIGLYKAIMTYKESEGKFSSYAYTCIKARLLDAVKAATRDKNKPLNYYVPLDKTELISSEDEAMGNIGGRELAAEIREGLTDVENRILTSYLMGMSYAEIALRSGKSVKYVDNSLQRIRKKVKKILTES